MYEEDNRGRNTVLAVLAVVFVAALVGIFFFRARTPEAVAAPAAYRAYNAPDKSFVCKIPDQWHREESGGMGIMSGLRVEKAGARIDILSDLQGSLMGDVARSPSPMDMGEMAKMLPPGMAANLPKIRPAVEQIHLADKGRAKSGIEEYEEGPMHEFPSPLGDARVSEWRGVQKGFLGISSKVHGYRATILGGERRVSVVCRCNDGDWKGLKPSFQTVMASLAGGGG